MDFGIRPVCKLSNLKSDISQSKNVKSTKASKKSAAFSLGSSVTKASFNFAVPGEEYIMLAVKDKTAENLVDPENLMYIDQKTAESNKVEFTYIPKDASTEYEVVILGKCSHSYESEITKEPTCNEEGEKTFTCSACGDIYTETIPTTEHNFTSWQTTKQPTCTASGTQTRTCSACGKTEKQTLKAVGHKPTTIKAVPATCDKAGKTAGEKYSVCGVILKAQQTVKATGHKFSSWKTTKKATYTSTGTQTRTCSVCKKTETKTIAKLATTPITKCTTSLAKTSVTYNGKAQTVAVTVKNGKTTLKAGTHYNVKFSNNTKIGKATVTITGIAKNGYSGTKTLTFNILPGKVAGLKVASQSTSSIKLTWSKLSGATGYRVYRHDGKKWVKVADTKNTNYTISKLKAGSTYKYAVRAYTTVGKATYWAASYPTVTTATKPATPTLKATAGTKQASLSWNKIAGATGYEVWMATSKNGSYKKLTTIKKNSTVKYTAKNLKKGTTYYFKVRAYKTVSGKNIVGASSAIKSVKAK